MEKKRDTIFLKNQKSNQDKRKKQDLRKQERNECVDEMRNGHVTQEKVNKKPFDKKSYRLKKYSNKYKLEKWEEQRKKQLLHEYKKSMKNEPPGGSYKLKSFDEDVIDSNVEVGQFVKHPDLIEKNLKETYQKSNKDPYSKAKEQYFQVKQEKIEKQEAMKKANEERMQKLQEYKKKKHEKFKKLSKKTKKGQPLMRGRLELLLEKIQASK